MSLTASISQSVSVGTIKIGGTIGTVEAGLGVLINEVLPASGTREIDAVVDVSAVKCAAMEANKDCTVKTNSLSSPDPDDTIVLKANQPLIWRENDPTDLFLTADVTKIFVVVGGEDTTFKFIALIDPTP